MHDHHAKGQPAASMYAQQKGCLTFYTHRETPCIRREEGERGRVKLLTVHCAVICRYKFGTKLTGSSLQPALSPSSGWNQITWLASFVRNKSFRRYLRYKEEGEVAA